MANYAYLRVSTDQQDLNNQRHGILEYANRLGLAGLKLVEDTASGKTNWKERKSGELLIKTMQKGDVIIFAEVSRMARSTLQVLEILEYASEREYQVHIAKQNMRFDDSLNAKITATVLGLAKRKAEGVQLGRPKGKAKKVKLDEHEKDIRRYLKLGISKRSIAKLVDCAPSTLYEWIDRRKIRV